jgi:hypothetical protein
MEQLFELTEIEQDAVAGGNPFSINISATLSAVSATISAALVNTSASTQLNTVTNNIDVSGS